jgi:hypothetical protein
MHLLNNPEFIFSGLDGFYEIVQVYPIYCFINSNPCVSRSGNHVTLYGSVSQYYLAPEYFRTRNMFMEPLIKFLHMKLELDHKQVRIIINKC